jgi:hypothetical protein
LPIVEEPIDLQVYRLEVEKIGEAGQLHVEQAE